MKAQYGTCRGKALHLAVARPFCRLKSPLGTSLFRCAPQTRILRFKKYKGPVISPIEAHNERTKEQYASNPDIDTSRSRYNLHLVQPQGRYREEADRMIAAAHCRVRKDSVRVVEALVTASPELVGARPLHLAAQDRSVT